ncbi:hypothetical protein QAD02_000033 [Eretmocerus hayati]|uniref:Uncharacterized protein n=1 Tax=Eretmocerus hayati TaxID=131215 RepID=A0ACC2NCG9_9HYME|nr:hypothetical protein QAD02_000033 [Eretmocerus hayati]
MSSKSFSMEKMDSPPPLVVLNDGLGGEMSFKTIEGCLIVDHIKAYFGNNVTGISYQPADSTSNGHQPKRTSVFISLGDSERIELPAHVEEYQVHYQQKGVKSWKPADRKASAKTCRKRRATSIMKNVNYKTKKTESGSKYIHVKVGLQFRLDATQSYILVPYYLVGKVSCRLDRKHNYSYAELVNVLGNSITNIITRV